MRITIVAVGTRMPEWVEQGVAQYATRLPREMKLHWREIPLAKRQGGATAAQLRAREGEQILRALPAAERVVAMDVEGAALSTLQLAERLRQWRMSGDNYSLLIGGPDGLSAPCLQRAEQRWSISALTLPHPLVRVVLAEQLYRAWTIIAGHPYHRA